MIFKKKFTIELDEIPETNEDICFAIAGYCAERNMSYEFLKRTYPVIAVIDGCKYEVTKIFTKQFRINLWVLNCKEID